MKTAKGFMERCLKKIVGWPREPQSSISPAAKRLIEILESVDTWQLTNARLDYIERLLAAGLAAIRMEQLSRWFTVREWRPQKKDPAVVKLDRHYCEFDRYIVDHASKLIHKDNDRIFYRSQPYVIDGQGIKHLSALIDDGWDIAIDGSYSDHFPGRTFAVLITRRKKTENDP